MKIAGSGLLQNLGSVLDKKTEFRKISPGNRQQTFLQLGLVAIIATVYLTHLTPGHVFVSDDFSAYVMHAANLVEGRSYTAINYVPNPSAPWMAPANGYPPVYPLLLAPVYKIWGLNLRAMKVVTVFCFVVFLLVFAEITRETFSRSMSLCVLLILSFNPVFWEQRDNVLSEFPYLMFSFASLMAVQRTYNDLKVNDFRIGEALHLSLLLYCSYGTRAIGIVLLPAVILPDLVKFRRPSRFVIAVSVLTGVLILGQSLLLTSPTGYVSGYHFSLRMAVSNAVFYAKTLSYVWQNGFSRKIQILFALLFTSLAAAGYARKIKENVSASEFYLAGYLLILFVWSAEIGMRGLLPVLPLYFAYGLQEFGRMLKSLGRPIQVISVSLLMLFASVTYAGGFTNLSRQPSEPNVQDATTQELFSFLRTHTEPWEVLIFPKPRSLALFTGRRVASLAPGESPEDSYQFMKSVNASILVEARWSPPSWRSFLEGRKADTVELFQNSDYRVFRIK
jgi:hypothetical protein